MRRATNSRIETGQQRVALMPLVLGVQFRFRVRIHRPWIYRGAFLTGVAMPSDLRAALIGRLDGRLRFS